MRVSKMLWCSLLLVCGVWAVSGQVGVQPERGVDTRSLPCGGGVSLSMVIDTTSSMKKPLRLVKKHAGRIVNTLRKTPGHHVHNYVAVPLNEPAPDHSMVTTQPAEFMDYVESFSAFGGGDCKERMLAALLKASDMSCPRSTIYVFSDASPKDLDLLGSVLSRLQEKKQQVIFALSGRCGDINSPSQNAIKTIATTSGGQLFWLLSGNVGPVLNYMRMTYRAQPQVLLAWQLHVPEAAMSGISLSVPVDSSVGSLSTFVSCAEGTPSAAIRPPTGAIPSAGSRQWTKNLDNVILAHVEKPPVGAWTVSVTSNSECMIRVIGTSPINLNTVFRLAEADVPRAVGGSPQDESEPHVVLAEIEGAAPSQSNRPTRGDGVNLFIEANNFPSSGLDRVQLVGVDGSELSAFTLNEATNTFDNGVVRVGPLTVPAENFYLVYAGQYQGAAMIRYSTTAVWPQAPGNELAVNPGLPVARAHVCGALRATCGITGHDGQPVPSVWTQGETLVAPSTRISLVGESTSTLEINPVHESDKGMYTCTPARPSGTLSSGYLQVMVQGTGNGPCMPSRNVVWNSRQCVFIHCTLPLANLHNRAVSWQHNTQSLTHDSRNVFIYSNGTLVTCSSRHGEEVPMSGEFTCRGRSQATGEDLVRTAVIPVEGTGNQEQSERPQPGVRYDACSRGTHDCDNHARCIPTLRSYFCKCHPGYTGDGQICTAISCAMPSNPRNGNVMISGGLGPGARISYSCQAGYEMMGSRQQQCQDNGQWSGSKPSCRMMQDEAEPTQSDSLPSFIRIIPADPMKEVDVAGCITLRCAVQGRTNPHTTWTHRGQRLVMTSVMTKLVDGSLRICPFQSAALFGTYSCLAGNDEGQMALRTFTIMASDIPSVKRPTAGPTSAVDTVPSISQCPLVVAPLNGQVSLSNDNMAGSIADYQCDQGFLLSGGDASRQCDGRTMQWTGQPPHCQEVQEEPTPPPVINSVVMTRSSSACVKLMCNVQNPKFRSSLSWTHSRTEAVGPSMSTTVASSVQSHDKYTVTLEERALHICDGDRRESGRYCCIVNLAGQRYEECVQVGTSDLARTGTQGSQDSCSSSLQECQAQQSECATALEAMLQTQRGN